MLDIRPQQFAVLAADHRVRFERAIAERLCVHFPALAAEASHDLLASRVAAACARARAHGLERGEDLFRYAALCAAQGWDFEERDETAWMGQRLRDVRTTSPSERLRQLVQECIRREAVERHNRELASRPLESRAAPVWYDALLG